MTAAEQDANDISLSLPSSTPESLSEEWLTDVVDQWRRVAFRRALERRHATPSYRTVIEAATLVVRTKSP